MYRELMDLTGKNAVVLGGAGGIGSRIVKGLLEFGASAAVVDQDTAVCEQVMAGELKSCPGRVTCLSADITDESSVRSLCAECAAKFGRIDILVNCVGGNMKEATTDAERTFFDLDTDAVRKVMDLNLIAGALLPAKIFGKEMVKNPQGGSIILISSMTADRPLTRIPGYSAAKAAVVNFTRWLAVDAARNFNPRLRVNAVAPGFFHTKQNDFLLFTPDRKLSDRGQSIIDHTPMKRFGDLDEITGAALWLASDLSKFVTGTVIAVDGGFSAFAGV